MPTDDSDPFDALDDADIVDPDDESGGSMDATVDPDDPHTRATVRSSDASRGSSVSASPTESDEPDSDRSQGQTAHSPDTVARCRWCRSRFGSEAVATRHDCPERPIASCRFCAEELTASEIDEHPYECRQMREWWQEQRVGDSPTDDPFAAQRAVVGQPHEFGAYIKYDTSERRSPFLWYYGFDALRKEFDGDCEAEISYTLDELPERERLRKEYHSDDDIDPKESVEEWTVWAGYKESSIAPPTPEVARMINWELDETTEFLVQIYPAAYDDYDEARQDNRKRVSYTLKPRWPDQESESGTSINPIDLVGFDVDVKGSYFEPDRYPELLCDAVGSLRERQGTIWNSPSRIDAGAFDPSNIHPSSNVLDYEEYVRIEPEETRHMIAVDGPLHRLSLLLADERDGYAKTVRDDTGGSGYYHTATLGEHRVGEAVGGHELPKEWKHYLLKNPEAVRDNNPLSNPKIGVSYQHRLHTDTVYWEELDQLRREIDEGLLNLLKWSGISLRPRRTDFVADDYFAPVAEGRFRKLIDDPTPEILQEQQQDVQRMVVAGNLNETDAGVLRQLVADGGQIAPSDLAEDLGRHVSTIRRAIQRLGRLVEHRYGDVQLRSMYVAQQIVKKLDAAEKRIRTDLEDAAAEIVAAERVDRDPGENTAWQRWKQNYVESIQSIDGKEVIELGWECADVGDLRQLIREGALRWASSSPHDTAEFASRFAIRAWLADGTQVFDRESLYDIVPGARSRYVPTG